MNEFPLGNPHPDREDPATKKEREVKMPALPEKVRIRPPREEDRDDKDDDSANQDLAEGEGRGTKEGAVAGTVLADLLVGLGGGL